jgi:hypothetical protein
MFSPHEEVRRDQPAVGPGDSGAQAGRDRQRRRGRQDGRIHNEKVNGPFLFEIKGTPAQYKAGLKHAIERGWIEMHRSGTFIRFTQAGADLFA